MNKTKINAKYAVVFILAAILLVVGILFYNVNRNITAGAQQEMKISLESGFYGSAQELTVNTPKGASVYYTIDCTEPSRENGVLYDGPISLSVGEGEMVYVYRFKVFFEDGQESEVITRTYFMGNEIASRYTTNVLHITGEPEDLFGYENGIFVGGKLFDEFVAANPDAHYGAGVDANFNMRGSEWEREVYAECFTAEGESLFAQTCGVRIQGRASRLKNQKSFKLYARKEYDVQNEFRYPLLDNLVSAVDGSIAQKYKRLVVRSGGTDNGFGYIRSELICELASEADFPDVMHSEPVSVYINGEYRGVYWMENTFDAQYFENRYGEYTGAFTVVAGSDVRKKEGDDGDMTYVNEFNQMYNKYAAMDLTVEENYQALCQVLDVENYLAYFAIETYIGNDDWPNGNVKAYRYIAEDNQYMEGTVFDGRYRHLLFDLDFGFGLMVQQGAVGIPAEERFLRRVMSKNSPLFVALMEREDCRNYFVNYSCDLMNGAMSLERVTEVLEEKHQAREAELRYMLEETSIQEDSLWFWEGDITTTYENVELSYNNILKFAENRPQTVLADLIDTFGYSYDQAYTLHVNKGTCYSQVQINSLSVEKETFSGPYIGAVPVVVKPKPAVNEQFEYWMVNGEIREEQELILTDADIVDAQITVEMIVSEVADPVLQICAVRAKGTGDFIEIHNPSTKVVSTKGYFLSDSDDAYKYALPATTLLPGETKRFYGKDTADLEGLGEFGLNFNIKEGETISLTKGEVILETLYIPDLSEGGIYCRDGVGDRFVEKL